MILVLRKMDSRVQVLGYYAARLIHMAPPVMMVAANNRIRAAGSRNITIAATTPNTMLTWRIPTI